MPRYTDIDKLIAEYDRVHVGPAGGARKLMTEAPIADVAPRAEVARLQSQVNRLKKYDEERDIALHARLIANTRQEVAREIFEEIEEYTTSWCGDYLISIEKLAELKKKYAEGLK